MLGAMFSMGGLLAAQAGGVALGQRQAARSVETVNRLADRDVDSIQRTGRMEFIPRAPVGPPRHNTPFLLVLCKAVVYPFLVCFVLAFVGSLVTTGMVSEPMEMTARLSASGVLALVVASIGAFLLAIPTVIGMWGSEMRKRVEADGQTHLRSYWQMREQVREWLDSGVIGPEQAYGRIASYRAPGHREPLPSMRFEQTAPPLSYDPYA